MVFTIKELENYKKLIDEIANICNCAVDNVNITPIDLHTNYFKGLQINTPRMSFSITPAPTGCGLAMLYNFHSILGNKDNSIIFDKILALLSRTNLINVGCIFATLGESFCSELKLKNLQLLGFQKIGNFKNPNMNMRNQDLFVKYINQKNTVTENVPNDTSDEINTSLPF